MVGFIAAFCTTISFIPQVVKVIKTKDVSGISLGMYIIFITGLLMWIVHGINMKDFAVICSNVFTVFFASIILAYKIKYHKDT